MFRARCCTVGVVFLVFTLIGSLLASPASAESSFIELTGLEVAESSLKYLELQKRDDGRFTYMQGCAGNSCIPRADVWPQTGAWAALAYTGLYEASGDYTYLNKLATEMSDLKRHCPPGDLDCRFVGVQAVRAYDVLGTIDYLEYLDHIYLDTVDEKPDSMVKAIVAREVVLSQKYGRGANTAGVLYSTHAAEQAGMGEKSLLKFGGRAFKERMCWLPLAWLEFASTSDDKITPPSSQTPSEIKARFMRNAEMFFASKDFSSLRTSENADVFDILLTELEPCIEGLIMFSDLTGDEKYRAQAKVLLEDMVNERWDVPYSKKFTGDYGFLMQACRSGNDSIVCYDNSKVVSDNGYAIYLFSLMSNETFRLKTGVEVEFYSSPQLDAGYPGCETCGSNPSVGVDASAANLLGLLTVLFLIALLLYYYGGKLSAFASKSQPPGERKPYNSAVVAVLVLTLLLLLYLLFSGQGGRPAVDNAPVGSTDILLESRLISACDNLTNQMRRDNCYFMLGKKILDLGVCERISNDIYKGNCFASVAIKTGDPKPCARILNETLRRGCLTKTGEAR